MDLSDAYANAIHIPGGEAFYGKWVEAARSFRAGLGARAEIGLRYGSRTRERADLFHPEGASRGLVVFVHGGYWMEGDETLWSHLAAGPLARGWTVAMPAYDLCPEVRIADITRQVARAIGALADRVPGPIRLTGHSAGGHLAARMVCADLSPGWRGRLARVVPISPLGDLAPLRRTEMNATLRIDAAEAKAESPVRHRPAGGPVHVWVGAEERPAFRAQARALGDAWGCPATVEPGRHHFDVIEGLERAESGLTAALLE